MLLNIVLSTIILWVFSFLYVKVDDFICDVIYSIKHKFFKKENEITVSIDILDDLKNPPLTQAYCNVHRFFNNIKEFPENLYYDTKYFIQRGVRGYSDRDCWNMDSHLTRIIPPMVKYLKEKGMGIPTWSENKPDDVAEKEWHTILDKIHLTFKIAYKIRNNYWFYQNSKEYDKSLAQKHRTIKKRLNRKYPDLYDENDCHVMTKTECIVYEEGWELLQKWFFSLWD